MASFQASQMLSVPMLQSLRLPPVSANAWWTASHLSGLSCFFWLFCLSGLPQELSQPMSKHNPETGGQREINLNGDWRIYFQDGLLSWLISWCWLLAQHLSSFPCGVSTGLIECLHSMVAVGSLQRGNPREQGEATLPFVIETQKLHTATFAISCWLYLFNLG